MKTNYKFTDTDPDQELRDYAQEKVDACAKFIHGADLEGAVADVEFRKSTHHKSGDVCYAEVTLRAGGKVYRSSKEEPTLKKAIDKVKDDILAELRKAKTKAHASAIDGAAHAKKLLQGEVD